MADILQPFGNLAIPFVPLVGHFVTDTPHDNARVVAEIMKQVHKVFLRPFIEEQIITVLAFSHIPFIKTLRHDHHTHFVTSPYQFRSRHIVGSTDRITPHVFQDPYLATDSSIVDGRPQRTEIVVIANALKDSTLTI